MHLYRRKKTEERRKAINIEKQRKKEKYKKERNKKGREGKNVNSGEKEIRKE